MNHHISHRENEIGFLHLRTLSIEVQVSFEHVFGSFIKFFEIIKIRFLRKSKTFFGPSFRSIHHFMPKIAIFSEGIFKMS